MLQCTLDEGRENSNLPNPLRGITFGKPNGTNPNFEQMDDNIAATQHSPRVDRTKDSFSMLHHIAIEKFK